MISTIGILHPGAMGASLGAALTHAVSVSGPSDEPQPLRVVWAGAGRSAATAARASEADMVDVGTFDALVGASGIIVSICPPDAAHDVAASVEAFGFDGIYVDANAISPESARSIGERFERFVDGGVIGPPAKPGGSTRLYLSGLDAPVVADCFAGTWVDARVLGGDQPDERAGAASALKMCFAAWTKGTSALLLAINALADAEGVSDALIDEWAGSLPQLVTRSQQAPATVGPKAWRFEAEMTEIATAFETAGLPSGFHEAAAEVYARLANLKGTTGATLDDVVERLQNRS